MFPVVIEHFRHLSVESIVHTHTSVGLGIPSTRSWVMPCASSFLSSMLIYPQLFTEGDLTLNNTCGCVLAVVGPLVPFGW